MNNVGSLRIRTSPPRNAMGAKKVWHNSSWVNKNSYLEMIRDKVEILAREIHTYDDNIDMLDTIISNGIRSSRGNAYINRFKKEQESYLIIRENLSKKHNRYVEEYNELISIPITPAPRRNRKTRKLRK